MTPENVVEVPSVADGEGERTLFRSLQGDVAGAGERADHDIVLVDFERGAGRNGDGGRSRQRVGGAEAQRAGRYHGGADIRVLVFQRDGADDIQDACARNDASEGEQVCTSKVSGATVQSNRVGEGAIVAGGRQGRAAIHGQAAGAHGSGLNMIISVDGRRAAEKKRSFLETQAVGERIGPAENERAAAGFGNTCAVAADHAGNLGPGCR